NNILFTYTTLFRSKLYQLEGTKEIISEDEADAMIVAYEEKYRKELDRDTEALLQSWDSLASTYEKDIYSFHVRGKTIELPLTTTTLSGLKIPKVKFPHYTDWGDRICWLMKENVPG